MRSISAAIVVLAGVMIFVGVKGDEQIAGVIVCAVGLGAWGWAYMEERKTK